MAYASDGLHLYIHGGSDRNTPNTQFFVLGLNRNWPASSPLWSDLKKGAPSFSGHSGAIDSSGSFLATGQEGGQSGVLYVYKNLTLTPFTKDNNTSFRPLTGTGPVIASNPNRDGVFFMGPGDGLVLDLEQPQDTQQSPPPVVTDGHAVSWCPIKKAVLGTYTDSKGSIDVRLFNPLGQTVWEPLNTANSAVPSRTGHCFVPDRDGSKYYLFGGITAAGTSASNQLFELDVQTLSWTPLPPAPSGRTKMACAVSATGVVVVWGGFTDSRNTTTTDNSALLFDLKAGSWVSYFRADESPDFGRPNGAATGAGSSSGSKAAIIGGAVGGGVALLLITAGVIFCLRRKKRHGQKKGMPSQIAKSGDGSMEMGGYTNIPSPFVPDESYYQQHGTSSSSSPPSPHSPVTNGSFSQHHPPPPFEQMEYATTPYQQTPSSYQPTPTSYQQSPLPYQHSPSPYQQSPSPSPPSVSPPPLKPRPRSVTHSTAHSLLASTYEPEPESQTQPALISAPPPVHRPAPPSVAVTDPVQSTPYHDRETNQQTDRSHGPVSRNIEPTSIDLIPVASETGDGSQLSRSNSLVSSRAAERPQPSRSKSKARVQNQDNADATEESRRDSTESLDYLDIS
ncbi:hypothetical protein BGX31_010452 [Mortierella sp. GBA43]|nr:hypothetical protein BGX31_010452 [Mortierella sp. GBA43]